MTPLEQRMVWALGLAQCVSWGVLFYGFGLLLPAMAKDLPFSHSSLSFMATLAALIAAAVSVPLGRRLDWGGHLAIMMGGSCLGVIACVLWSQAETLWGLYVAALFLGLAQAATLYEPVFAFLVQAFSEEKARHAAMLRVTLLGGLSSTIFMPLMTLGMQHGGWRRALLMMAALLLIPAGIHGYWNRRLRLGGTAQQVRDKVPLTLDGQGKRYLSLLLPIFLLNAIVHTSITTHLPSALLSWGFGAYAASWAVGIMGAMQLLGRLGLGAYLRVLKDRSLLMLPLFIMALSLTWITMSEHSPVTWAVLGLLGASSGLLTLLRPIVVSRFFDVRIFGRVNGLLGFSYQLARAAGPVGGSFIFEASGRYESLLWVLAGMLVLAGVLAVFLKRT